MFEMFRINVFGLPIIFEWWAIPLLALLWFHARLYVTKYWAKAPKDPRYQATMVFLGLAAFASIALHETAHALVAYAFGHPLIEMRFSFLTAGVKPAESFFTIPPLHMFLICAAGPAMNWLLGMMGWMYVKANPESFSENSVQHFAWVNISLGRLNLVIPFLVFDGGKMLDSGLRWTLGFFGIPGEPISELVFIAGAIALVWYIFRDKITGVKHKNWEDTMLENA